MWRIRADDIGAFDELYARYSARTFGLARIICDSSHRAEDAVQDGFSMSRATGRATTQTAAARKRAADRNPPPQIDRMRRGKRHRHRHGSDGELAYLPASGSVAEDAELRDEADRLRASLRRLPVAQREVIALAYFAGLTQTEIATRLRLPAGTGKGRIRLGLSKIRAEIDPAGSP